MIYDHKDYQERIIPTGLDHIRVCSGSIVYINPPQLPEEDWMPKEDIEQKLQELLDRYDVVESTYQNNTKLIHSLYDDRDEFTREFFFTLESQSMTEAIYLSRWLRYWQKLYEKTTKTKLVEYENEINQDSIDTAKEVPIESLYDGNLRHISGKFVGLCPFHTEKTPSFTIFNDNHFHCFGCQASGDSISFYMRSRNVDFVAAVKELAHV